MRIKFWVIAFLAVLATGIATMDMLFHTRLTTGVLWIVSHLVLGGVSFALTAIPHLTASGLSLGLMAGLELGFMAGLASVLTNARNAHHPALEKLFRGTKLLGVLAILLLGSTALKGMVSHTRKLICNDTIGEPDRSWTGVAIGHARQLTTGLQMYAADHDGKFPSHLGQLVEEGILSPEQFAKWAFATQYDGLPIPWVYFNGLQDSAPDSSPLLMHPLPGKGGKRIVAFKDSSVDLIPSRRCDEMIHSWKESARNP